MSDPYQIFVLAPSGIPAKQAIERTAAALEAHGGRLDDDSTILLNDYGDEEPEPESVGNASEAIERLAGWPTLGSLDYAMPEGMTTVSFFGPGSSQRVQAVKLSMMPRMFERGGEETLNRYRDLARSLHEGLEAKRTVMGWGLEVEGLKWPDEIRRIEQGDYSGTYPMLDLRDTHA